MPPLGDAVGIAGAGQVVVTVVVRSLGSGSSGNALVIETSRSALLVDCGLAPSTLSRGLAIGRRTIEGLTALLVSHEHVDHVRALQRLVKAKVPIVATAGTGRELDCGPSVVRPIQLGSAIDVDGIVVRALGVSHDAAEPCGYYVEAEDVRLTVLTDLGCANESLLEPLAASDLIVLEANHDEDLVRRGPYPSHLKRRLLSPMGHLSNADCGALLRRALAEADRPRTIWLAHLSAVNNRPDLAVSTVASALAQNRVTHATRALPRRGAPVEWRSDAPFAEPMKPTQLRLL
jgi:phosphoribosyl 1,2-cyclic phosphodiesterase